MKLQQWKVIIGLIERLVMNLLQYSPLTITLGEMEIGKPNWCLCGIAQVQTSEIRIRDKKYVKIKGLAQ